MIDDFRELAQRKITPPALTPLCEAAGTAALYASFTSRVPTS
jgi:hypothetical protein